MTVATAGCGRRDAGPEPLPIDRVNCARCGMLISSSDNAGEIIASGEETRFYDDIGCLAGDAAQTVPGTRIWVHRTNGDEWIEAGSAWFAESARRTPMGHVIGAYASQTEASRDDVDGRARRWDDIIKRTARQP